MRDGLGRHNELAGELVESWEDLWQRGTTSRVVLVAVPPGWGRTTVLNRLVEAADSDDAPVTLLARVNAKELPGEAGPQAMVLREILAQAAMRHRVAELLGMDRLGGITQMGLGVGGLFVSGMAAAVGLLVMGVALSAAGKAVGVLAEIRRDEIGERDDPAAGLRFGRPERTAAAGKVVDLTSNPDSAGVQVDVVGTKCSEFSPAKAGLDGQEDQRCISRPHGVGQGVDLDDGQDWTFR
jgi:hypothetical protein